MNKYIIYEVKNALGNIFTIIFGFIFPILMTLILFFAFSGDLEGIALENMKISMFVTNMIIVPLAILFIGFSALFSQEIERKVTLRMSLYGYTEIKQLQAKFVAQFLVVFLSLLIYCVVLIPIIGLEAPSLIGLLLIVIFLLIISFTFYVFAFAISLLAKKFSIAFGLTMSLYFIIMILSGMMGVSSNQLPIGLKEVSQVLPTTHLVNHSVELWHNYAFNMTGLMISTASLLLMSLLLAYIANKQKNN